MTAIYIQRATGQDLPKIMTIIGEAKALLAADHSPQWQDGHPKRSQFIADIQAGTCWVLMNGNEVAGTATLMTQPDPNYAHISGGHWVHNGPYATIHRIAISSQFRGQHLSRFFFSNLITVAKLAGFDALRIDTHAKNERMQHLASDFGFQKRGIIEVVDKNDPKRLAYELSLD